MTSLSQTALSQRVLTGSPVAPWALGRQALRIFNAPGTSLADAGFGGSGYLAVLIAGLYLCTWWSVILLPGMPLTFDLCSKVQR